MKTLPMPVFETDEDWDAFYNGDEANVGMTGTRNSYDALQTVDRLLEAHGLEIGIYDNGSSDFCFTIVKRVPEIVAEAPGDFVVKLDHSLTREERAATLDRIEQLTGMRPTNENANTRVLLFQGSDNIKRDRALALTVSGVGSVIMEPK